MDDLIRVDVFGDVWSSEITRLGHSKSWRIYFKSVAPWHLLHIRPYSAMSSEADKARLLWSKIFAIRTLHEATLQELLGARNYATMQLLDEHNDLLCEQYLALGSLFCVISLSHLLSLVTGECCSVVPASSTPTTISSRRATQKLCYLTSSHNLAPLSHSDLFNHWVDIIQEW